ncbi:Glucoside xylosyltransferase 2 [Holothuria leucospilota]|uniref:UDP-D-xylose:beta-D-glucoside alpha-1,3-D-xylosyltransferase n=1 Tax=Holothuria leucospilota TaxID=206669 RepID=A0A9Q1HKK6_HOLLE|nr:Glucoside xylosyltransferase 2 [Holothuria leucospilota]
MRHKHRQAVWGIPLVCFGLIVGYYIGSKSLKETGRLEGEPKRHSGSIADTSSWAPRMNGREQDSHTSNSKVEHSSHKQEFSNAGNDVKNKIPKTNLPGTLHGNFAKPKTLGQNNATDELPSIQANVKLNMTKFFVNGKQRFEVFPDPQPLEAVEIEPAVDVFGKKQLSFRECIQLSVVVCGNRTTEALVMLKSATILSHTCLIFHVFAEDKIQEDIRDELNHWPNKTRDRMTLYVYPITYPSDEDQREWKAIFKSCATQRIFIPELLPKTDTVLYVDTDILFIRPIENIWQYITSFSSKQFAGMSPVHENPANGWYNRNASQPYYGELGLNSGVMLLNLTRMRDFKWSKRLVLIYKQYKDKISLGDQDLINVVLFFHSDTVLEMPCEWNYRPHHCSRGNTCQRIETEGIALLHGFTSIFHSSGPFGAVYETYRDVSKIIVFYNNTPKYAFVSKIIRINLQERLVATGYR